MTIYHRNLRVFTRIAKKLGLIGSQIKRWSCWVQKTFLGDGKVILIRSECLKSHQHWIMINLVILSNFVMKLLM